MIKKFLCILLSLVSCLSIAACAQTDTKADPIVEPVKQTDAPKHEAVPLTDEEIIILDAMGTDVHVVTDEDYVNLVAEIIYHTHEFVGDVYQLEGLISIDGDSVSVYRTLVNGTDTLIHGLPLRYLSKDIADGSWIRVTGVVAEADIDGVHTAVLDIVAIESVAEYGQDQIPWDGSEVHKH